MTLPLITESIQCKGGHHALADQLDAIRCDNFTIASFAAKTIRPPYEVVSSPDPPRKNREGSGNTYGNAVSARATYSRQSDYRYYIRHVQSRMCKLIGIHGDRHGVQLTRLSKFPEAE